LQKCKNIIRHGRVNRLWGVRKGTKKRTGIEAEQLILAETWVKK
jgi:hypothetical protein